MNKIKFYPWILHYDYDATVDAYNKISKGDAENCGCIYCNNFIAVRDEIYPLAIKDLFQRVGVDYKKEYETYHNCRLKSGLHDYGGSFHFIGKVEAIGNDSSDFSISNMLMSESETLKINDKFSISMTSDDVKFYHDVFEGYSLVEIVFLVEIPWVIEAKEPE